jgi:hypothetical protein
LLAYDEQPELRGSGIVAQLTRVRVEKNERQRGRDPHKRAKVSAAVNQSPVESQASEAGSRGDYETCVVKSESFAFEAEFDDVRTRMLV